MDYKYSIRHEDDELDKWVREQAQSSDRSVNGYILNILKMHKALSNIHPIENEETKFWRESLNKKE